MRKPHAAMVEAKDLTLSLGLVLGRHLFQTESMHYGYWPEDLEVRLQNLAEAQSRFTEFVASHVPSGVGSICEIGSGSGELAQRLARTGRRVDCVCPGGYLSDSSAEKLEGLGEVFASTFEDFESDRRYDLVLFSESFHYISMDALFEKLPTLLEPGGRVLICDFFKKTQSPGSPKQPRCAVGGGHNLSKFRKHVEESPFEVELDVDITDRAAPTIDLLGAAYAEIGAPCRDLMLKYTRRKHPILTKLCTPVVKMFFRRKLDRLNRRFEPGVVSAAHFAHHKEYRLLVLRKDS